MVLAFLTSGAALAFSLSSGMRPTRSSATRVAMQQDAHSRRPHVAVIGGGWGGWGAAKALIENGVQVTLLDTLADPTGSTPYVTPTGKPFEAGTRGFWMDYPNINELVANEAAEGGRPVSEVFTPFTNSSFYSPDGLEATAPVFSEGAELFGQSIPELPSPLGQIAATISLFERIPLGDRATMLGLLYAMLDFVRDEETFEKYDRMSAHELFRTMGLSKRLIDDLVRPTLLVGLFKAPEELSAAVAMELLYFYALAHQTSFDVRWIKSRSISELIIAPLAKRLASRTLPDGQPALTVMGGCAVSSLVLDPTSASVSGLEFKRMGGVDPSAAASSSLAGLSGVVLAVGAKGMRAIAAGSPALAKRAPELCAAASLPSIDVIACRLWLDIVVPTRTPANVLSRFDSLRGAGGTFFMLDQLQCDELELLWGGSTPQGSCVACDFYNAGGLLPLDDEAIVELLLGELLPAAVPGFAEARLVDSHVARFPGAVSWFAPGSFSKRPPLQTSVPNLVCAGDWVRMGEHEHGAKGLCQERAYVSGIEAANALSRGTALGAAHKKQHAVIPIRDDEPQYVAARAANKVVQDLLSPLGLDSPWVR